MSKVTHPIYETAVVSTVRSERVDQALRYLDEHQDAQVDSAEHQAIVRSITRKIDLRILPLLFLVFAFQFLDKVAYNYAAVMDMPSDLHLTGNDYTNAATFLYVAYIAATPLSMLALQTIPATLWLSLCALTWGVACAACAGTHNYSTLLTARIFLGIGESGLGPSLTAITSQWWRKDAQPPRFTTLYLGLGIGQIVGGLASYGFQGVQPGDAALAGWRILFLVLGGATVLVAGAVYLFIPSSPMRARWLSDSEKTALLDHLKENRTGIANYAFARAQLGEALTDPGVVLLLLNVVSSSTSAGIGTTYSATLVRLLGFAPRRAALLNTPSGAVMVVSTALTGVLTARRVLNRGSAFVLVTSVGLIGSCILAFEPSPTPLDPMAHRENLPTLLAGLYLVSAQVPSLALQYAWSAANVAGATKKAVVYALVSACFAAGNIVGLQSFQARDVPSGYRPAKIAVVGTQAGSIVFAILLVGYYAWQNKRRDSMRAAAGESSSGDSTSAWKGMSDREDVLFRYSC